MAAARFRPPKTWTPPQRHQPRPGNGPAGQPQPGDPPQLWERETAPVLRVSRTGIRNMPRKQQEALRKERKADPEGHGVHSWRRRQW